MQTGTRVAARTAQSIESHTLISAEAVFRATETTRPYFSKGEEHTFTAQADGKVSSFKRDKVVSRVCQSIVSDIAARLPKDVGEWLGMR